MGRKLFLLFNHRLTDEQKSDARESLGVEEFIAPSPDLRERWSQIPSDLGELRGYLEPIRTWLSEQAAASDYVLVQGDFGATYLIVRFALKKGLMPVYSTTKRTALEEDQQDGSVKIVHRFKHKAFRKYGV